MNILIFIDVAKPGEIIITIAISFVAVSLICFFVGYKLGYYKGKDAARRE